MKTIFINSYYSEIDCSDVNNSGVDGIYKVTYDEINTSVGKIKKSIKLTYSRLLDEDVVCCLGDVLVVLQKEHNIVSWEVLDTIKFDCDYGIFK